MKLLTLPALAIAFSILAVGLSQGEKQDELKPFHAIHAENDFACADCHSDAETSMSGTDALSPGKAFCADCHDVEDESECATCHTNAATAMTRSPHGVAQNFPHAVHIENGLDCTDCHGTDEMGEPQMPEKAQCRDCHATATAMDDCLVCHATGEELLPISHTPKWENIHGEFARWDDVSCMNCHTQTDCQDCHSGDNVRPRSHRLNFEFDHALEARGNEMECQTCHLEPQFCSSCHAAEQVLPQNHSRGDWIMSGSGGSHAEEARFDLENCVACHDAGAEAPICATCHGEP